MKLSHLLCTTVAVCSVLSLPGFAMPKGNRVVEIRGTVEVKLPQQSKYQTVRVGMLLEGSDWLRVQDNGQVTLRCETGSARSWFTGPTVVSSLCPPPVLGRSITRGSRGCDDPNRLLSLWRGLCLTKGTAKTNPLLSVQLAKLNQQIDAIKAEDIGQQAKLLIQAEEYFQRQLFDQVIATLEPLVQAENQIPVVYRWLGDAYEYTGQVDLANQHYQTALKLSQATQNETEAGAAAYGLAKLAARQQDLPGVERWLQQAQLSYGAGQLEEERQQIEELSRKLGFLAQCPKKSD